MTAISTGAQPVRDEARGPAGGWAAATVGSESAAPLQLATGKPVLAIGGFNGTDPTPTLAQFERLVSEHKIHYFVGQNRSSFGGGSGAATRSPRGSRLTSPREPSAASPSTTWASS